MKNGGRPTASEVMKNTQKIWLIVTVAVAAAVDALISAVLIATGADGAYLSKTALLLVVDILYLLLVLFSHMRFSYTRKHVVLFAVLRIGITLWMTVTLTVQDEKRIFVFSSLLIWAALNFASVFIAVFAYLYAARRMGGPRILQTVFAAVMTAAIAATATCYGVLVLRKGFFGQGSLAVRPLLYRETEGGYIVSEVAQGRGTRIVVPAKFNGKKSGGRVGGYL